MAPHPTIAILAMTSPTSLRLEHPLLHVPTVAVVRRVADEPAHLGRRGLRPVQVVDGNRREIPAEDLLGLPEQLLRRGLVDRPLRPADRVRELLAGVEVLVQTVRR